MRRTRHEAAGRGAGGGARQAAARRAAELWFAGDAVDERAFGDDGAAELFEFSGRPCVVFGQRADDACDAVEKFLDVASLASVDRVRIVHGHGMGILKRAVGDLLKRSPLVTKFYPATSAEGGNGATIAELK